MREKVVNICITIVIIVLGVFNYLFFVDQKDIRKDLNLAKEKNEILNKQLDEKKEQEKRDREELENIAQEYNSFDSKKISPLKNEIKEMMQHK